MRASSCAAPARSGSGTPGSSGRSAPTCPCGRCETAGSGPTPPPRRRHRNGGAAPRRRLGTCGPARRPRRHRHRHLAPRHGRPRRTRCRRRPVLLEKPVAPTAGEARVLEEHPRRARSGWPRRCGRTPPSGTCVGSWRLQQGGSAHVGRSRGCPTGDPIATTASPTPREPTRAVCCATSSTRSTTRQCSSAHRSCSVRVWRPKVPLTSTPTRRRPCCGARDGST